MNAQKNMKHVDIELQKIKGRDMVSAKIDKEIVSIFRPQDIVKAMKNAKITSLRLVANKVNVYNGSYWRPSIRRLRPDDEGKYTFWSSRTDKKGNHNRVALFRDSAEQYHLVWFNMDRPLRTKQWVEYPETPRRSEETKDVKLSNKPFSLLTLKTATKTVPKVANEFPQLGTPGNSGFKKNWKTEALSMKLPSKQMVVKTTIPKSKISPKQDKPNDDGWTDGFEYDDGWTDGFD